MNHELPNILNIRQLNKNIMNIHQLPLLSIGIGANIAVPYESKGSPDRLCRANHYNKVILCSDRHGNSEEMLREANYE